MAYLLPMIRGVLVSSVIAILIPAALWMGSVHVEDPRRLVYIWIAIPLELFGPGLVPAVFQSSERMERMGGTIFSRLSKYFQFYPAVNIEHKTERMNAFVTIVFGYSVVALLYQNQAPFGINAFFGKALLGLVQAFSFNMIYFEIDNHNIYTHAIRRHFMSYIVWMWLHLPFIMSFVLASGSLSKLVLAHDCPNADPSTLAPSYAANSSPSLTTGLRWFYSAGLGISLACMGLPVFSLRPAHLLTKPQAASPSPTSTNSPAPHASRKVTGSPCASPSRSFFSACRSQRSTPCS